MPRTSVLTVIFTRVPRVRRQGARTVDGIKKRVDLAFDSSCRATHGLNLLKPRTIALPLWWFPRDSLVSDGVKDEQLEELKEDSQDYAALHIMQLSKALNDSSSEVAAVAEAQFLKDCSKYLLGKPVWKQVWSPLIPSANAGAGKTAHLVTGDRAPRLLEWVRGGIGDAIVALARRAFGDQAVDDFLKLSRADVDLSDSPYHPQTAALEAGMSDGDVLDYIKELREAVVEADEDAVAALRDNHTVAQLCVTLYQVLKANRRAPSTKPLRAILQLQEASELLVKALLLKSDVKLLDVRSFLGGDLFDAVSKTIQIFAEKQAERDRERGERWAQMYKKCGGKLQRKRDEDGPSAEGYFEQLARGAVERTLDESLRRSAKWREEEETVKQYLLAKYDYLCAEAEARGKEPCCEDCGGEFTMVYGPHNGDEKRLNPFNISPDRKDHTIKLYRFWLIRLVCNFCNQVRMNSPIAQGKVDATATHAGPPPQLPRDNHLHRHERLGDQEEA